MSLKQKFLTAIGALLVSASIAWAIPVILDNNSGIFGHFQVQGTIPAITSCGTGSPAIEAGSTDTAGRVTLGTSATGCVITFAVPFISTPICSVTWEATPLASQSWSRTITALTLVQTSTSGNIIDYVCVAKAGG